LKIGEEVFSHIAYLDFKDKTTSFPWLRAAMLCCNLSATKVVDGFGKCLTKSDCDRFRSKDLRPQVLQAENMLALNWDLAQKQPFKAQPTGYNLMGRCMVRVALHLSKKEAKGRDTHQYADLGEIATKFSEELVEVTSATMSIPAKPRSPEGGNLAGWFVAFCVHLAFSIQCLEELLACNAFLAVC
jgi:hypothetical protein